MKAGLYLLCKRSNKNFDPKINPNVEMDIIGEVTKCNKLDLVSVVYYAQPENIIPFATMDDFLKTMSTDMFLILLKQ